jgi:hypothetical protein
MTIANVLCIILGVAVLWTVLLDAFETAVLPRKVQRHLRLTGWYYRLTWKPWAAVSRRIKTQSRREALLGYYGPLSLIVLLGVWAAGLVFGFALVQYGVGGHLTLLGAPTSFGVILYHSGETFFTLGYGDVVPSSGAARFLAVLEAGLGFAFLGIVIGYLPTTYAAFSRREIEISLLDARAGSPPSAAELLRRYGKCKSGLDHILQSSERWSAEVLESHLSYPALSFFRSQHNNQSWLAALTTILDATALLMAGLDGITSDQATQTFAMARHAVVDLSQVVTSRYDPTLPDRLTATDLSRLQRVLAEGGLGLRRDTATLETLGGLRAMYEPYVQALARSLVITLPPWVFPETRHDNWEVAPWDEAIAARRAEVRGSHHNADHF